MGEEEWAEVEGERSSGMGVKGKGMRAMRKWRSKRLVSAEHLTADRPSREREGSGTDIRALLWGADDARTAHGAVVAPHAEGREETKYTP